LNAENRPKNATPKTASEQRELTEAMASIRLHANYQDPLEEWKKQSQKEAFVRLQLETGLAFFH